MRPTTEACEKTKLGLAAEILRAGGTIRLRARGASMLPTVWPGDWLTVESLSAEAPIPGDIVLVARDSGFRIHRLARRIVREGRSQWITRGDALPRFDPPAEACEVLGRVSVIDRGDRLFAPERTLSWVRRGIAILLSQCSPLRNFILRRRSRDLSRFRRTGSTSTDSMFYASSNQ